MSYKVNRVEGWNRSAASGAPLKRVVLWQVVDSSGRAIDSFRKRSDAVKSIQRLNRAA